MMQPTEPRPDEDIQDEIEALTWSFAPLKASRGHFVAKIVNGKVTLSGNVRIPQARRVLLDNVPRIHGVVSCDASQLYDDEMVRSAVGQLLPEGIAASVHFGAVALTGTLPEGMSAEVATKAVNAVPGVVRVASDFNAPASATSVPQQSDSAK
jgi:osmotically-inducible protein OsmY